MRHMAILTAALLVAACDTPENDQTVQADAGDAMMNDTAMDGSANDGMAAGETVTTANYVNKAAMSDMYEIEAGKMAADKGQSPQTRQFGQMMVNDHTKSSQDMKAALDRAPAASPAPARLDAPHQAMLDRLESAEGEAFDREYMTQQMNAHRTALALHEGYANTGDAPALKAFAQKVLPVIRQHHDRLNELSGTGNAMGAQPGNGMTGTGQTSTGGTNR